MGGHFSLEFRVLEFAGDTPTGAAAAGAFWVAALDNEIGNVSVEDEAIVEACFYESGEVFDRDGRGFGIKFNNDVSFFSFNRYMGKLIVVA